MKPVESEQIHDFQVRLKMAYFLYSKGKKVVERLLLIEEEQKL